MCSYEHMDNKHISEKCLVSKSSTKVVLFLPGCVELGQCQKFWVLPYLWYLAVTLTLSLLN